MPTACYFCFLTKVIKSSSWGNVINLRAKGQKNRASKGKAEEKRGSCVIFEMNKLKKYGK